MSRTIHSTTGNFFDSSEEPRQQQRTSSNTNNNKEPAQSYRFGDVVFVLRRIGGTQPIYHHAGIVTGVLNGNITQILHFDPLFDRKMNGGGDMPPWELVKQTMIGVWSYPEFIDGQQLKVIFPDEDLHIEACGPTAADEIQDIYRRIDLVRHEIQYHTKRLYQLHAYNCQHFAMEMRTGVAHSPDADAALASMFHTGVDAGVEAWNYHKGGSDAMSTVKGALAFLWEAGAASAQEYVSQVQSRKANAVCRQ